jgi:hypothetical protein
MEIFVHGDGLSQWGVSGRTAVGCCGALDSGPCGELRGAERDLDWLSRLYRP